MLLEDIKNKIDEYHSMRKNILNILKENLNDYVKEILKDDNNTYVYLGYTPYFNDGDTCVYGFYYNDYIEDEDGNYINLSEPESLRELFSLIGNDFMLDIYDDHLQFNISKNGIITQDYDHD